MKKLKSFSIVTILCVLAFLLFSGVECNESDDPKCSAFKSEIITWRPTPIAQTDQLLNPVNHYQGLVGTGHACLYWYQSHYFVLCRDEAVIFSMTVEMKEEHKDKVYSLGGFIEFPKGKTAGVDNFTYDTNNGVYTVTGELTVSGNSDHFPDDGEVIFACVVTMSLEQQTDIESTHAFFNNVVHAIKINYAYTMPQYTLRLTLEEISLFPTT